MRHEDLHIGDIVVIRDWNDMAEEFGVKQDDYRGLYICTPRYLFLQKMQRYCGKVCVIDRIGSDYVELHEECNSLRRLHERYSFCAEMLRPLSEVVIEFSDADLADFDDLIAAGLESKPDRGGESCEN